MIIKRFIAGAVCPSCGTQDTVRLFEKNGRDVRECVECDFSDEICDEPALVGEFPTTRISHDKGEQNAVKKDQSVQIVRILDS